VPVTKYCPDCDHSELFVYSKHEVPPPKTIDPVDAQAGRPWGFFVELRCSSCSYTEPGMQDGNGELVE